MVSFFSPQYLWHTFCWISLPCGWTAGKIPQLSITFSIKTVIFVEAKTHVFIKVLVISYQNVNLSQFKTSLLLPHLAWPVVGRGPFLSFSPTSFTAPRYHPAACSSSRVNTSGKWHHRRGHWVSFYINLCCFPFSLGYQSYLCEVKSPILVLSWGAFVGSSEVPHGTPHTQFPNTAREPFATHLLQNSDLFHCVPILKFCVPDKLFPSNVTF